jgi:hypothetical protein
MIKSEYSFLPWLRRGLSNRIQIPAAAGSRARVSVSVTASSQAAGETIAKDVQLIGPGDVIGINPQMIVRTEPRNWITDFEPNYLPFVEFYDEDFPWRYTPTTPDASRRRLAPWIFLLVLKEEEFQRDNRPGRPLPSIKLTASASIAQLVPPDDQLWAWAHVHLNSGLSGGGSGHTPNLDALDTLLRANPDAGYARLLNPRRLEANTGYFAFVIPTFETGRRAGLGEAVPDALAGLDIAWKVAMEFPVYYEWFFRTGAASDFEELVRALKPRTMNERVGIRDMDIRAPGFNLRPIANPPDGLVGLEGALKAPATKSKGLAAESNFPAEIVKQVNLATDAVESGVAGADDPVITPPLYGRWHALTNRIAAPQAGVNNWVNELNADPRHRAVAGMGTRVIQKHQEDYMKLAWQQIGEILAANRKVHAVQFALRASDAVYSKHIVSLPPERTLPIVSPVFTKVMGSPVTLHYLIRESRLPRVALSGAFRKQMRPRGLLVKRFFGHLPARAPFEALLPQLNEGGISAAPPRTPPAGPTLEAATGQAAPKLPDWLKRLLPYNRILAWFLFVLLILLFLFLPGALVKLLIVGAAIAGFALYRRLEALRRDVEAAESLAPARLTPQAVAQIPPRPSFSLLRPGQTPAEPAPGGADSPTASRFRAALTDFHQAVSIVAPPPPERRPVELAQVHTKAMQALDPAIAFPRRVAPFLRVGNRSVVEFAKAEYKDLVAAAPIERVTSVMAYPDIKQPMYEPLRDISSELLVPNLKLISPNTISLMETNPPFIESYMLGLNHEFARELLWREYPTDQRPSSFRQFWDVSNVVDTEGLDPKALAEKLRDIKRIHEWPVNTVLGSHNNRPLLGNEKRVVLVIRGDLLKRYPNTIIYAQRARWGDRDDNRNRLALWDETGEKSEKDPNLRFPLFKAQVPPDIHFIGFDLTLADVRGHKDLAETAEARATIPANELGWFFAIKEVVGEPRFGLDEKAPEAPSEFKWDNLSWENLGAGLKLIDVARPFAVPVAGAKNPDNINWGANAADMAYILFQKPVLVAVHAREMLKDVEK